MPGKPRREDGDRPFKKPPFKRAEGGEGDARPPFKKKPWAPKADGAHAGGDKPYAKKPFKPKPGFKKAGFKGKAN